MFCPSIMIFVLQLWSMIFSKTKEKIVYARHQDWFHNISLPEKKIHIYAKYQKSMFCNKYIHQINKQKRKRNTFKIYNMKQRYFWSLCRFTCGLGEITEFDYRSKLGQIKFCTDLHRKMYYISIFEHLFLQTFN